MKKAHRQFLRDMAGYLVCALAEHKKLNFGAVLFNIQHDIQGIYEVLENRPGSKCFLPRTSGYGKHLPPEVKP